jgi:parallel beta-helix repeat protein
MTTILHTYNSSPTQLRFSNVFINPDPPKLNTECVVSVDVTNTYTRNISKIFSITGAFKSTSSVSVTITPKTTKNVILKFIPNKLGTFSIFVHGLEIQFTVADVPVPPIPPVTGAYYVDGNNPAASDSNNGSESNPWKTISKAANTLIAGETVYIKSGTYKEKVYPANSGTADKLITYTAYPNADVWIDGSTLSFPARGGLFQIGETSTPRNYINVSKIKVKNAFGHSWACGILVIDSNYVTVDSCYTLNTQSSGICVARGSNIKINNNDVELSQRGQNNDTATRDQECLTLFGVNTFEVTNNRVFNSPGLVED